MFVPTVETANLGALWALVADTLSGRTTDLADPGIGTTAWENDPVVVIDAVTVTVTLVSAAVNYIVTCPRPASTWVGLSSVNNLSSWRRALFTSGPTLTEPQPSALLFHRHVRTALLEGLWGALGDLDVAYTYEYALNVNAQDGMTAQLHLRVRTWADTALTFTASHPTTFTGQMDYAVDVSASWVFRRLIDPPGTWFWTYPLVPDDCEVLSSVVQFPGLGDSVNAEQLAALHLFAEKMAQAADRGGAARDHRGRLIAQVAGVASELPIRAWTIDSALRRLAVAARGYAGVDTFLRAKNGALVSMADGVMLPGRRR